MFLLHQPHLPSLMSQLKGEDRRFFIDFNPYSYFSLRFLSLELYFFFSNAALVLLLDTWHRASMPLHCCVGVTFLLPPFFVFISNEERRRLLDPPNHRFFFLSDENATPETPIFNHYIVP